MKPILTIYIIAAFLLATRGQTVQTDTMNSRINKIERKLASTNAKLDVANALLNTSKVDDKKKEQPLRKNEVIRYIEKRIEVPVYTYDTVYIYDTIFIYKVPPVYGGDSVQKAQWKQLEYEGNFFRNLFKWRR